MESLKKRKRMKSDNGFGSWYYEQQDLGFNYRLTDFQAALGISQLNRLDSIIKKDIPSLIIMKSY